MVVYTFKDSSFLFFVNYFLWIILVRELFFPQDISLDCYLINISNSILDTMALGPLFHPSWGIPII
jgi:hypothetical protein